MQADRAISISWRGFQLSSPAFEWLARLSEFTHMPSKWSVRHTTRMIGPSFVYFTRVFWIDRRRRREPIVFAVNGPMSWQTAMSKWPILQWHFITVSVIDNYGRRVMFNWVRRIFDFFFKAPAFCFIHGRMNPDRWHQQQQRHLLTLGSPWCSGPLYPIWHWFYEH